MSNSPKKSHDLFSDLGIKPKFNLPILLSSMVGSIIAIIVDLRTQGSASTINAIKQILDEQLYLSGPMQFIITVILLLAIAGSLSQIFDIKTKKSALYLGASILTVIFTFVPYNDPPPVKIALSNSEQVTLILLSEENEYPSDVLLKIYDTDTHKIVAQSKMIPGNVRIDTVSSELLREIKKIFPDNVPTAMKVLQFYLDKGTYEIRIEATDYRITGTIIEVDDILSSLIVVDVPLVKSFIPLFLQRAFN